MLQYKLRRNILEKRRGKLHENAPVHTAGIAQAAIIDCGFDQIGHTRYSPNLVPSHYYPLGKLEENLCGHHFSYDEEVVGCCLGTF